MINKKLVTKNKKIFLKKFSTDFILDDFSKDKIITKNILSSCKHGTEQWIINQKAHWIKFKRDKNSNFFLEKKYSNYRDEQSLGNVIVGKIIKTGKDIKKYKVGDKILAYSGSADYSELNIENIICKVKKNVPNENYLCFDPLIFAIGAIRDGKHKFGDNIAVVGLGAIGLVTLMLLKKTNHGNIIAVDKDNKRLSIAKQLGATHLINSKQIKNLENFRTKIDKIGMDVVIDFSGSVSGLNTAISLCKYNGKVVAGSMYSEANSKLKLGKEFHWNNIKIISSRVTNQPSIDSPSWNIDRIHKLAINIIENSDYDFKKIINKKFNFNNAVKIYKKYIKNSNILKITFKHNE